MPLFHLYRWYQAFFVNVSRRAGLARPGANVSVPEGNWDAGSSLPHARSRARALQLGADICADKATPLPGSAGRILSVPTELEPVRTEADAGNTRHQVAVTRVRMSYRDTSRGAK